METVVEALRLLKRQAVLEATLGMRGGTRVAAEQELRVIQSRLGACPEAAKAVLTTAHSRRCSILELTAEDVENWVVDSAA
jgi:hypothetical protein